MDARMKELADFCKMQKLDNKIRNRYEMADEEEAFSQLVQWQMGMFWLVDEEVSEGEMLIEECLHSKRNYFVFQIMKECMKKGYTPELEYVGTYDGYENVVVLFFKPMDMRKMDTLVVKLYVSVGRMKWLCEQINSISE